MVWDVTALASPLRREDPLGQLCRDAQYPRAAICWRVLARCGWHSTTVEIDTAGTLQEEAGELVRW